MEKRFRIAQKKKENKKQRELAKKEKEIAKERKTKENALARATKGKEARKKDLERKKKR